MKFYEFFIAFRYMLANLKQSLIIILAVGIGVSIIIWIPSINLSFFNDLIDKSVSSAAHIEITKELDTFDRDIEILKNTDRNLLLVDQTVTRKRNIKSYRDIIRKIFSVKGVTGYAPYTSGQIFIIKGADEKGVSAKGIIPELEVNVTDIENDIIKGNIKNLGIDDIVIGVELAKKLNIGLHDRIIATGPRGTSKSLKVTGIFETGLRAKDEWQVYVSLKTGQNLLEIGNDVSGIGIAVDDIYKADIIADKIKKITNLEVTSWKEDNKQILDQINRFRLIIAFINFLIIFSAASSITSVFILLIASKSKQIGILKSMGAKNSSIMFIFVAQAIILSLTGFTIGVIGAQVLLIWYQNIISASPETILGTGIPQIKMNFNYAMLAFFYSIITSLIASILPAYQAAKLNPVEAINE
ncbi:MAG: FtsX-like permease family protein [Candidatus Gastranaerophilales bacterium]|nr:FtsX-like permease family protein [Candidatus Gastranaerophilales bacterium]